MIENDFCEKHGIVRYGAWGFECQRNGQQAVKFNKPRCEAENWNLIVEWVTDNPTTETAPD